MSHRLVTDNEAGKCKGGTLHYSRKQRSSVVPAEQRSSAVPRRIRPQSHNTQLQTGLQARVNSIACLSESAGEAQVGMNSWAT